MRSSAHAIDPARDLKWRSTPATAVTAELMPPSVQKTVELSPRECHGFRPCPGLEGHTGRDPSRHGGIRALPPVRSEPVRSLMRCRRQARRLPIFCPSLGVPVARRFRDTA